MVEIGYSLLVPTVFDMIRPKIPINYWWLRSPGTVSSDSACNVLSTGHVDYDYHNVVPYNSYGRRSPDTYMGGSEGVMQVADYGEIQFETWLNSSYGNRRARTAASVRGS